MRISKDLQTILKIKQIVMYCTEFTPTTFNTKTTVKDAKTRVQDDRR